MSGINNHAGQRQRAAWDSLVPRLRSAVATAERSRGLERVDILLGGPNLVVASPGPWPASRSLLPLRPRAQPPGTCGDPPPGLARGEASPNRCRHQRPVGSAVSARREPASRSTTRVPERWRLGRCGSAGRKRCSPRSTGPPARRCRRTSTGWRSASPTPTRR